MVFLTLDCFGQSLTSQNQSKAEANAEMPRQISYNDWLNYATNNSCVNSLFQQKHMVDSQIDKLQKERNQLAADHHDTYTNTPYQTVNANGDKKVYVSRLAFDDETISGLIKMSLKLNAEITRQRELFFVSHVPPGTPLPDAAPRPPTGLTILGVK